MWLVKRWACFVEISRELKCTYGTWMNGAKITLWNGLLVTYLSSLEGLGLNLVRWVKRFVIVFSKWNYNNHNKSWNLWKNNKALLGRNEFHGILWNSYVNPSFCACNAIKRNFNSLNSNSKEIFRPFPLSK